MKPKQKGFTLIELLIVIAIIGILVTIAIVAIDPIRVLNNARDGRSRSDLNQVKTALQLYHNENGRYPNNTGEFATPCTTAGATICFYGTNAYMKQPPTVTVYYANDAPGDDYDAGVALANPSAVGNDSGSFAKCSPLISVAGGPTQKPAPGNSDYFICPD